jgi:hypothetical protein
MSEENNTPVEQEAVEAAPEETQEQSPEAQQASPEITKEDAADVIKQAKEAGASKQEIKQLREVLELKVNGKIVKKEVDWNDKEALKREFQMAYAGREAMAESAELKKLFANEIGRLKSEPWEVLKELGLDPDELAELRIQARIDELSKSPEQKERERLENEKLALQKEVEEARSKLKQREEREKELERQKFESEVAQDLETNIIKALDAHKDISASPKIISRIADTMLWAMDNGFEDVSPEDVIPTVRKELRSEINDLLTNLPEDFLEEYIGSKNIERMRKKRIEAAKKAKSINNVSNVQPNSAAPDKSKNTAPKQRFEDFMRLR